MFIIFGLLILIMLLSAHVNKIGLDKEYLSIENTQAIKGIFVILIF